MGYKRAGADNQNHEFLGYDPIHTSTGKKKTLKVSSNVIDGQWTPLKEFMSKHHGVHRCKYPLLAAEFDWRHNNQGTVLCKGLLRIWRIAHSNLSNPSFLALF